MIHADTNTHIHINLHAEGPMQIYVHLKFSVRGVKHNRPHLCFLPSLCNPLFFFFSLPLTVSIFLNRVYFNEKLPFHRLFLLQSVVGVESVYCHCTVLYIADIMIAPTYGIVCAER